MTDFESPGNLRVEVRFKNAVLYNALEDRFAGAAKSLNARGFIRLAAEQMHVELGWLYGVLRLKSFPFYKTSGWTTPAGVVASFLHVPEEILFPAELYGRGLDLKQVLMADAENFVSLSSREGRLVVAPEEDNKQALSQALDQCLHTLTPREEQVLKLRYGIEGSEQTFREIGLQLNITGQRVRQIQAKALRKLRHPTRTRVLLEMTPRGF